MPSFTYRVRDKDGRAVTGSIEAANRNELAARLRGMGYAVSSIEEAQEEAPADVLSQDIFARFKNPKARDMVVFSHQLSTMIGAGLTLTSSLAVLVDQVENKKLKSVIDRMRKSIEEGNSFSNALEEHREVFSPVFINMVRAGEASGNLETVLDRLAAFMEDAEEIKAGVKNAITYPAIMIVLASGVMLLFVRFVFPQLANFLIKQGVELPWPTALLIWLNRMMTDYWFFVLLGLAGACAGFFQFRRTEAGRRMLDRFNL